MYTNTTTKQQCSLILIMEIRIELNNFHENLISWIGHFRKCSWEINFANDTSGKLNQFWKNLISPVSWTKSTLTDQVKSIVIILFLPFFNNTWTSVSNNVDKRIFSMIWINILKIKYKKYSKCTTRVFLSEYYYYFTT